MTLPLQTFNQLVENQASAVQASSTQLVDFSIGSVSRALAESNAGNSIWIQGLISALLAVARLQTSSGNDVDTFIQQFGYSRTQAVAATGSVTFSRTITTSSSSIPATTTIVSASGTNVQFFVTIDTTNAAYDSTTQSYIMAATVSSVTVPVQCLTAGIIGNVLSGAINTINTALINVTSITNASAFTNGTDIATDAQTKIGFVQYLAGLSKATYAAIASVVSTFSGITRYLIVENKNESSATQLGYFYVVIDNGSGTASSLVSSVLNQVNLVRGLSIVANVDAATANVCSGITATVTVPAGTTTAQKSAITATIKTNVQTFFSSVSLGSPANTIFISRIIQIIYDASTLISDVEDVTLNGSSVDPFISTNLQVPTIVSSTIIMTYVNP